MPQRDYVARSNEKKSKRNKKESNVKKILAAIIILVLLSGVGLWLMKTNAPKPTVPTVVQPPAGTQPKSELPSRPEETWSYIRDLETRTVITDNSQTSQERIAQLTAQQKQQIEERRKQEEARLAQQPQTPSATAAVTETETAKVIPAEASQTDTEAAAKKAEEQRLAEEKRKAEQAKAAAEKAQKEKEQQKVVATAAKPTDKPANQVGKFGLQCGAFKNKAQAENMQARLAMAGFNARIVTNAEWNRVFVGPIGDRAATSSAQTNARSVAECVIVAM